MKENEKILWQDLCKGFLENSSIIIDYGARIRTFPQYPIFKVFLV
jgi:hypothetical protein